MYEPGDLAALQADLLKEPETLEEGGKDSENDIETAGSRYHSDGVRKYGLEVAIAVGTTADRIPRSDSSGHILVGARKTGLRSPVDSDAGNQRSMSLPASNSAPAIAGLSELSRLDERDEDEDEDDDEGASITRSLDSSSDSAESTASDDNVWTGTDKAWASGISNTLGGSELAAAWASFGTT